jgi:putative nucleotidyltransferase with HDIG domain
MHDLRSFVLDAAAHLPSQDHGKRHVVELNVFATDEAAALGERTARALGLGEHDVETIRLAAILHDVGKLGVPDRVLCKQAELTPDERELVQRHPEIGADIIERIPFLREVSAVVRHHQEWYDGRGYPRRLSGEMIPLGARIVAVVDAYNAMTTDRPYRKALSQEQALDELRRHAGTQFDPGIVATFIKVCALPGGHGQPGRLV